MHPKEIKIEDYSYSLPDERIAQYPLEKRDHSKLLVRNHDGSIVDRQFFNLPEELDEKSLLIFNETRVIRARLIFPRGEGMRPIEIFCLNPADLDIEMAMSATGSVSYMCMVGNAKKWKGQTLEWFDENGQLLLQAENIGREEGTFIVKFSWPGSAHFAAVLETLGHIPLPPYMHRSDEVSDANRYQTVYATRDGSVAAPTAGLHFSDDVMENLTEKGIEQDRVVLHVGAGTFKPVSSDTMSDHDMHSEAFEVKVSTLEKLLNAENVVAVGTTSTRTLESLYWLGVQVAEGKAPNLDALFVSQWEPYEVDSKISLSDSLDALIKYCHLKNTSIIRGKTQIIIAPGYRFKVVNQLITNFHQPHSTLILLVAAAIGESWKEVYAHALNSNYRFLSYGDSSLLSIH